MPSIREGIKFLSCDRNSTKKYGPRNTSYKEFCFDVEKIHRWEVILRIDGKIYETTGIIYYFLTGTIMIEWLNSTVVEFSWRKWKVNFLMDFTTAKAETTTRTGLPHTHTNTQAHAHAHAHAHARARAHGRMHTHTHAHAHAHTSTQRLTWQHNIKSLAHKVRSGWSQYSTLSTSRGYRNNLLMPEGNLIQRLAISNFTCPCRDAGI